MPMMRIEPQYDDAGRSLGPKNGIARRERHHHQRHPREGDRHLLRPGRTPRPPRRLREGRGHDFPEHGHHAVLHHHRRQHARGQPAQGACSNASRKASTASPSTVTCPPTTPSSSSPTALPGCPPSAATARTANSSARRCAGSCLSSPRPSSAMASASPSSSPSRWSVHAPISMRRRSRRRFASPPS